MSRPQELAATCASILAAADPPAEVVVADASADDRTERLVRGLAASCPRPPFTYVKIAPGLPAQRNAGAARARGEAILFLDDDVTLAPDYFGALAAAFDDAGVGGACGVVANQVLPGPGLRFLQWLFCQVRYARRSYQQRSGLPTFLYRPASPAGVAIMTGCNMAFRRAALPRFDERINYFDDDDASLAAGAAWRLVQTPAARVEHRVAPPARPDAAAKVRRRILEQRLLHRRHLPQDIVTVGCYYYSVLGAAAVAALRLRPRLWLATLAGLWDVARTGGGRRLDAALENRFLPRPEP